MNQENKFVIDKEHNNNENGMIPNKREKIVFVHQLEQHDKKDEAKSLLKLISIYWHP